MCYKMWEIIARQDNQLTKGAALKTKCDTIRSYNIPLSKNIIHSSLNITVTGMYAVAHYDNKVCGQSGSIIPRSPRSGILVPCGHCQIFIAAQVWHGMSQALVSGHSTDQLVWQEQLEPVSSGLPVLQVQQVLAACMVQVEVMQVVLLKSGVLSEPAVWQLCHLGQCWLL